LTGGVYGRARLPVKENVAVKRGIIHREAQNECVGSGMDRASAPNN
jgi:hypothetical protein